MLSNNQFLVRSTRNLAKSGYHKFVRPVGSSTLQIASSHSLLSRANLQSHTTNQVSGCYYYDEEEIFECPKPAGLQPLPEEFETEIGTKKLPKPFVSLVKEVDLVGSWGLPVAPETMYLVEEAEGSIRRLFDTVVKTTVEGYLPMHRGSSHASTTITEPVASFVGPFDDEYFHWFTDYLPRILGLEAYKSQTGEAPKVLIPADPPDWLTKSLEWTGVGSDRWIEYPGGRVHVKNLVIPSMRRHAYDDDVEGWSVVSPKSMRILRDRIREATSVTPSSTERVYISRSDSDERRVVNEDEVMNLLDRRGFERYVLSELSLYEQARLFANASEVVSPHGAGLVNTIYGEDLSVVELFGDTINPCYYSLAAGFGFNYAYLCCEPTGPDMRVNVDKLESTLGTLDS